MNSNRNRIKSKMSLVFTIIADLVLISAAFVLGFFVRGEFSLTQAQDYVGALLLGAPLIAVIFFISFSFFKLYRILWQYAKFPDYIKLLAVSFVSYFVFSIIHYFFICPENPATGGHMFPRSAYIIGYMFVVFFIFGVRTVLYLSEKKPTYKPTPEEKSAVDGNIMIVGAGKAASLLISDISNNPYIDKSLLKCLIDDNPAKKGSYIDGVIVHGGRDTIEEAVKKYDIKNIIFAIVSCAPEVRSELLSICSKTGCSVRTMPGISNIINGTVGLSDVRDVKIEDLLGRSPISIDIKRTKSMVFNKVVMVTGGGGSIGSELCRQIATLEPKKLIIFDIYENNAYEIQQELKRSYPNLDVVALIGSVRDTERLRDVFTKYRPNIVYHAAAHKHVPLMEESPNEAIKNNVFGTYKTALAASKYGVEKFVLISTDKAVNPTNIMGASKRMCEMIIQCIDRHSETDYAAVRFGNVLGSNGSVIPLFKKQIAEGGPVTVTHPDIIRYFMTIPEAVSLVLTAGAYAHGGEIFILDMGKPVKIVDLAENLIRLSGHTPGVDIKIEFTGLRPGEKLYEELLMSEEGMTATENELIYIGKPISIDEEKFMNGLEHLREVMYDDNVDIRSLVRDLVPTYKPKDDK